MQSVYNLATLLSGWMEVKVVTRNTDLNSAEPYPGLQANQWTELAPHHQVLYLDSSKLSNKLIKQLIKENKNNIIYINGLFSWFFSFLPALLCTLYANASVYISVRGMLHQSALSVKPFKKQIFLAFARGFGLYKKPVLIASNEQEKHEIYKSVGKVNVAIAPNLPGPVLQSLAFRKFKEKEKLSLLCVGRIAPEKNPNTLLKALAGLQVPIDMTFCGGYNNPSYFAEFKDLLKALPANIDAGYLGELPNHQIADRLRRSDVMIMPSLGENFGHAIYESLALGVPVIIGNNTPWKHLEDDKAGLEVNPIDTAEIAAAILKFDRLSENDYQHWCQGALDRAKAYMEQNDFKSIYSKLFV